ncbi:MAG: cadherin-like beta sandwich domain-containing protein [Oscillospiraceae bacterium]|nr:cadherin-like beta sandwich domain-containing protein [Oscillospiraceae bacterium]
MNKKIITFLILIIFLILLVQLSVLSTVVLGNDPTLKSLSVNVGTLDPKFDSSIIEYIIVVPENVDSIDITATPNDSNATVNISGNKNLKSGLNKVTIKVTAENGQDTRTYTIDVTKGDESKANANLSSINVENASLVPDFSPNIVSYVLEQNDTTKKINVTAQPEDAKATVSINDNSSTDSTIYVTCTAPDGITTKTYMLTTEPNVFSSGLVNGDTQDNNQNIENLNSNDENALADLSVVNDNTKGNPVLDKILLGGVVILIIIVIVLLFLPERKKHVE